MEVRVIRLGGLAKRRPDRLLTGIPTHAENIVRVHDRFLESVVPALTNPQSPSRYSIPATCAALPNDRHPTDSGQSKNLQVMQRPSARRRVERHRSYRRRLDLQPDSSD